MEVAAGTTLHSAHRRQQLLLDRTIDLSLSIDMDDVNLTYICVLPTSGLLGCRHALLSDVASEWGLMCVHRKGLFWPQVVAMMDSIHELIILAEITVV